MSDLDEDVVKGKKPVMCRVPDELYNTLVIEAAHQSVLRKKTVSVPKLLVELAEEAQANRKKTER